MADAVIRLICIHSCTCFYSDCIHGLSRHALFLLQLCAGETLFCEGDWGDHCYIVASGSMLCTVTPTSDAAYPPGAQHKTTLLRTATPGHPLGEVCVVHPQPRSVTATASEDTLLLQLAHKDLHATVAHNAPDLWRKMLSSVEQRAVFALREVACIAAVLSSDTPVSADCTCITQRATHDGH